MKLISLTENTSERPDIQTVHGLSLYLETRTHRILFDFGPNKTFLNNARTLGVDLSAVDAAFLSHGHYDHGGGIPYFLEQNDHAPIYIHRRAFEPHLAHGGVDIGIDPALRDHPQVRLIDRSCQIDSTLSILTGITGRKFFAASNAELLMQHSGSITADDFAHEQCLLVQEDDICLLLAGCAHNGIVNILEHAERETGRRMTHVISGFHLCQPTHGIDEAPETVRAISAELAARPTRYYTCHCTGLPSYRILHQESGGRVKYLPGGASIML